ncbi:MAG: hypothetical protein JEZ09_00270 [Salinivirgaceae bacterium]|nr:hypothetical protein [Salinivirgaceae bacterium]
MRIITICYQLKKMFGINESTKADKFVMDGLSESYEPSEKTLTNILGFSNAYRFEKSKNIGDVEYLIN